MQSTSAARIDLGLEPIWHTPPVDPARIAAVRAAALAQGLAAREIVNGAGHDAVYMARVVPTAMIFVPCKDSISHNEAEFASPEACTDGANTRCSPGRARDRASRATRSPPKSSVEPSWTTPTGCAARG